MIKDNKIAGLLISIVLILTAVSGIQCTQVPEDEVRIGYLLGDLHHLPFFVALDKASITYSIMLLPPISSSALFL